MHIPMISASDILFVRTETLAKPKRLSAIKVPLPKRRKFSVTETRRALKFLEEQGYKAKAVSVHADGAVKIELGEPTDSVSLENPWDKVVPHG